MGLVASLTPVFPPTPKKQIPRHPRHLQSETYFGFCDGCLQMPKRRKNGLRIFESLREYFELFYVPKKSWLPGVFVALSIQLCIGLSHETESICLTGFKFPVFSGKIAVMGLWPCSCFIHFIEFAITQNSARHWSGYDSDLCMVSARRPTGNSKAEFKSSSRLNISWNLPVSCAWASRYLPSKFASSAGLNVISSHSSSTASRTF